MKETVKESIKEALRVCLIAVIPVAVDMLSSGKIDIKALLIVGGIAILRFIDKALYLTGKETGNEMIQKGLTRF